MKKLVLSSLALLGLVSAQAQCFDVGTGADGALVVNGTVTLNSGQIYNYTTVTINSGGILTVPAWNGTTGGTLILKVQGTLTINAGGSINVTGLGYRGGNPGWGQDNGNVGCGTFSSGCCLRSGIEGEILGAGFGWAGGYPSGNGSTGGGGGGSYGTLGTAGQGAISPAFPCAGGKVTVTYGTANLSTLFLGSGGGAGGACGWDNPGTNGGVGGNGGGIIKISATTIINNGSILCNGQNAGPAQPDIHGGSGGGGGGSGGSIYLLASTITNSSSISAIGGTGTIGTTGSNGTSGQGGNGGMGRIRLDYNTLNNTGTISPVVGFTATVSSITATQSQVNVSCNGGNNGTATVTASGGTPPYTYAWAPSGGTNATATGLAANTYTCTITDANTCTTQQTITITQPTVLSLTVSAMNATCFGSCNGMIMATGSGGTGPYTYAPTLTNLCAGVYTVTVTDANGCTTQQVATVGQPAAMTGTATASPTQMCPGGCTNLSASFTGGSGPFTFNWTPVGTYTPSSNVLNPSTCPSATTTFTCTVTDANGCTVAPTVTVTVNPLPTVTITPQFVNTCVQWNTNTLTGSPVGGIYTGTAVAGTNFNPSLAGVGSFYAYYTYTDGNGCTNKDSVLITVGTCVGITENGNSEAVIAFPNPFSDFISIDGAEKGATVKITNALGETVYTSVISTATTTIDTRKFSSGIYFVEVQSANGTTVKKIVKE